MKKFLLTFVLMFVITPAFAANKAVVQCLNSFSSNSPSAYFSGKVVEEVEFKNGVLLRQGAILNGITTIDEFVRILGLANEE